MKKNLFSFNFFHFFFSFNFHSSSLSLSSFTSFSFLFEDPVVSKRLELKFGFWFSLLLLNSDTCGSRALLISPNPLSEAELLSIMRHSQDGNRPFWIDVGFLASNPGCLHSHSSPSACTLNAWMRKQQICKEVQVNMLLAEQNWSSANVEMADDHEVSNSFTHKWIKKWFDFTLLFFFFFFFFILVMIFLYCDYYYFYYYYYSYSFSWLFLFFFITFFFSFPRWFL